MASPIIQHPSFPRPVIQTIAQANDGPDLFPPHPSMVFVDGVGNAVSRAATRVAKRAIWGVGGLAAISAPMAIVRFRP